MFKNKMHPWGKKEKAISPPCVNILCRLNKIHGCHADEDMDLACPIAVYRDECDARIKYEQIHVRLKSITTF